MDFDFTITHDEDNREIGSVLKSRYSMSSTLVKRIKLYGELTINGTHARMRDVVSIGDIVHASYYENIGKLKESDNIKILYEDDYLAVVNKPSNMVTHPTHDHQEDSLTYKLSDKKLHPVIRLDRDTTGLLILAKNGYIHNALSSSEIRKHYIAVIYGTMDPLEGTIDAPIARRENSVMIREVSSSGKPSITLYKTLYVNPTASHSMIAYKLLTGRCHQIRVHSLYKGHPLVGDGLYGPNSIDNPSDIDGSLELDRKIGRQALHAASLKFTHPITNEEMSFVADLPGDMKSLFPELESFDKFLREASAFH